MADNTITYSENFKVSETENNSNDDNKIYKGINEMFTGEGIESNLQTPLMFSRSSSPGSLTGCESHFLCDDQRSITTDFSPRPSDAVSPSTIQNGISENLTKSQTSGNNNSSQKIQEKIQYDDFYELKTKAQLEEKINLPNISFQYDIAFKKPHFFKHSVFEDDIAAFKDESSPNFLSTAASSLSSLTIDDEDYGDNTLPNKAGLFKNKLNITDKLQSQRTSVQEHGRRDPIGGACELQSPYKPITSKNLSNNQQNVFSSKLNEMQSFAKLSNETLHTTCNEDRGKLQQRRTDWTEHNVNRIGKFEQNSIISNDSKSIRNLWIEANDNANEHHLRRGLLIQQFHRDKIQALQCNGPLVKENRIESDIYDKYANKYNGYENFHKEEREFVKQNKICQGSYKMCNETNHSTDENNDLNTYEEQLLDQCIRKGMAKVTKRNISDIKPFCWDLNQICLTTRAMFKNHGEDIIRDRRGEFNKQRLLQRGSTKKIINSKTK